MRQRISTLELYDEDAARRVAGIVGDHSAAAKALRELDERRARGEIAGLLKDGNAVVVFGFKWPLDDPKGKQQKTR